MLIYAHRGASFDFPELTSAAYLAAIDQGADGFECDVRLTKDGIAILWHNSSMRERAGNNGLIAEMNFAEVERAYPQVLTLGEFLGIAITHKKHLLLETKHPVISGNQVEQVIVEMLKGRRIEIEKAKINISVMSFSWGAIEKMKRLNSEIERTLLMHKHTPLLLAKYSSADAIGPGINELRDDPALAGKIKNLGRKLYVWTVDNDADIKLCSQLGVDILITNKPAHARSLLK